MKKRRRELRRKMRPVRVSLTMLHFIPPWGRVQLTGWAKVLGLCSNCLSLPVGSGPGRHAKGLILFYVFRIKYFFLVFRFYNYGICKQCYILFSEIYFLLVACNIHIINAKICV
jgi:hypothetical protein